MYKFQGKFIKTKYIASKNLYLFKIEDLKTKNIYDFAYKADEFLKNLINKPNLKPSEKDLEYLAVGLEGKVKFFETHKDESPLGKTDWDKVAKNPNLSKLELAELEQLEERMNKNFSEYPLKELYELQCEKLDF